MKKFIANILVLSTVIVSCNSDLDINSDPDFLNPDNAPLSAQLPAGITGIVGSEGAGMAIFGGFWSQYWTQSNNASQFKDIDGYSSNTSDHNYIWNGMYDALGDIRNVKRKALAEGNWKYYLIATTLEVQASQVLTDMYGDIPYKEAGDPSIRHPKFDTGEEIYTYMIEDLNDALSKNLNESVGSSPANDDLIFGGNMENWTKFANTLKLKIYMRQTHVKPSESLTAITSLINSGVSFLDVDASMVQFVDEINQSNPLYEYIERNLNTPTNLRMSTTLSSYLIFNSDTRKDKYYEAGNALNQGDYDNPLIPPGSIAVVNLSPLTPVFLLSKEESLFLQAEAMERIGNSAVAQTLYEEAVKTNFSRYALDGTPYLSGVYAYPNTDFESKLEAIIIQKWIASFPGNGFEAFFETNRTGYPKTYTGESQSDPEYIAEHAGELAYSINGSTNGLFPKRIEYPLSERNANNNAPDIIPITTPVWWAQN